ncbi:MAG: Ig-like domain-containing protein [Oscillospiraceae bacterium]
MKTRKTISLTVVSFMFIYFLSGCNFIGKASLNINEAEVSVKFGERVTLKVDKINADDYTIRYESKDTNIATVDNDGVVTGVIVGTTDIEVFLNNDTEKINTQTIKVNVLDNPELTAQIEVERLAQEKAEAERVEAERLAQEKAEAERVEAERLANEKKQQSKPNVNNKPNTNNSTNKPQANNNSTTPPVTPPNQGGWTLTKSEVDKMIANAKSYGVNKGLRWEPSLDIVGSYGGSGTKDTNKISNTYQRSKDYVEQTLKGSVDSYIKGYNIKAFYVGVTDKGNGHWVMIVYYG